MKFAYLQEPPFCFTDASGAITGCDVELAKRICQMLGEDFSSIETEFAELLPGLVDGRWDMTTGLFISEERSKLVDFTRPIWSLPDGLMVARANPLDLTGYRSIARHPSAALAVISDQIQHQTALRNGVLPQRIRIFATQAEAAEAVAAGHADVYASVAMAHRGYVNGRPGALLDVIDVPASERQPAAGAFALAKGNDALRRRVDQCLGDLLGSAWHREIMGRYGFSDSDIDRLL
ncbi:transporter substrate-binding domain-containing protein [Mesorhizobium sp. M2D.F.Ca.ET.185.01.1.1]|uniref:transporter substrate-binding domain-containing protein n=1 Tax=unclassified Mesorhizobium TaxID=325217 RepID=UPI000FCAF9C7|nr:MULTISPECIES: transporter substrate-binding domain-containing protein [unclassified Mesorhizobium]TGP73711.1 transporter substrate-binding domain-containing protein [bacterium M00.F.Ca.ET.227.01.1.1]TGP86435.1 transporter substrate-binding domain-containing protein [bacterium M00.F.Ca.ET.221.01.1.1]TGP86646.1 transporter substrate-binding domain-containing protein [bacterium M00.F.Ca.ET.222.01.1.1]TGU04616.1 transporter substrate-binding domain-containing protein [bacterium M00.F.Ca.ET.163.0